MGGLVRRILESYDSLSLSYEPRILEEKTADMCSGGARRAIYHSTAGTPE